MIDERHRPARLICAEPEFLLLGLTDAGIVHQAIQKRCLVLTDDAPLGEHLARRGVAWLSFDDLRSSAMGPAGGR